MPRKASPWQDILKTLLAGAIMATCAAALSTWVEVKLLRKDVDELRRDVDRLWSETSDSVAELQGAEPIDIEARLADIRERLREREAVVSAAAAAAPQ